MDAPPSTYAAQIVDKIEGANHQKPQSSTKAQLKRLFSPILQADREGELDGGLDESLEVNQRLVVVTVQACLLSPSTVDPFQDAGEARGLQIDCLSVIEVVVRRRPEALLSCPLSTLGPLNSEAPVFLWLIPNLLNCLLDEYGEAVRASVRRTLSVMFMVSGRSSKLKLGLNPILKYGQGCVNDLLHTLESFTGVGVGPIACRIPSNVTLEEALLQELMLPQELPAVSPATLTKTFELTIQMIAAISSQGVSERGLAPRAARSVTAWSIDCLFTLWSTKGHCRAAFEHCEEVCFTLALSILRVALECSTVYRTGSDSVCQAQTAICHVLLSCMQRFTQIMKKELSIELQKEICWTTITILRSQDIWPSGQQECLDALALLTECSPDHENALRIFSKDFQRTLLLVLGTGGDEPLELGLNALDFDDQDLGDAASKLPQALGRATTLGRPSKRPRLQTNEETAQAESSMEIPLLLSKSVAAILESPIPSGKSLQDFVLDRFPALGKAKQCELLIMLGRSACSPKHSWTFPCALCDTRAKPNGVANIVEEETSTGLYSFFLELVRLSQTQKSPPPRVAAMIALKHLLAHTTMQEYLDLKSSALGQWCLQCLRSSVRELRLAAIKTLSKFVCDGLEPDVLSKNRLCYLDSLRTLSEKDDHSLQETCILALGEMGMSTSKQDELNIVLLRLIEFLGHQNALVSNLAFEELQRLSQNSSSSAMRLFEPYWRTVAVSAVKDLIKRPQICQSLSDLLGITVSMFLKRTQFYTIPYLILTKNQDVLQRIVEANGPPATLASICLEPAQLAAVLACLMSQPSPDPKNTILNLLAGASPEFEQVSITELLRAEPMGIAFELLKLAGEHEESSRTRARQALQFLAEHTPRRNSSSRSSGKRQNVIAAFFEEGALGIMQQLSDTIGEAGGLQPLSDRRRCVGAIQEMIILGKSHLSNALPQICSCLRSAMKEPSLRDEAALAWLTLLTTMGEDDLENLVEPTFAMLAEHGESLASDTQRKAFEALGWLFEKHKQLIQRISPTVSSVKNVRLLDKFEKDLGKIRMQMDAKHRFEAFATRCQSDNSTVVSRALTEMLSYLEHNQSYLQEMAVTDHPDPVLAGLVRALLDSAVRFRESESIISVNIARCLGLIGCLDPTKVEMIEDKKDLIVLSNFADGRETLDFIVFFIQEVLVKTFLSTTDTRSQGLLSYALQELLRACGFEAANTLRRDPEPNALYKRWIDIPQDIRNVLTPFITSQYVLAPPAQLPQCTYPIYDLRMSHTTWLRQFTLDLLSKCVGENTSLVFEICKRIIRRQDLAIPSFLLPYAVLNIVLDGARDHVTEIANEVLYILSHALPDHDQTGREDLIACSQNVFHVLDYCSRWLLEKRKEIANMVAWSPHNGQPNPSLPKAYQDVDAVERILAHVPAQVMSQRSIECRTYARALFYWEQHIREKRQETIGRDGNMDELYEKLQEIYTQIDEPDGIEGISARLQVLNINQQIIENRKTGKWTAVQSWCELQLEETPDDPDVQLNLLTSLKESGQHDVLLNQVLSFGRSPAVLQRSLPFAVEACWSTSKWNVLAERLADAGHGRTGNFNVCIGKALLALQHQDEEDFKACINQARIDAMRAVSRGRVQSLDSCHDVLLRLHALTELEAIGGLSQPSQDHRIFMASLDTRIEVLGAFESDKRYLLGMRRAAMELSRLDFSPKDLSSSWLASAKLARKAGFTHQALKAVLHASRLGDDAATIEHARLLWKEGNHRKAIQRLEGSIAANAFQSGSSGAETEKADRSMTEDSKRRNPVAARAILLLAKWIDRAGQTQSNAIISQYQTAINLDKRCEKSHYYLGRHYNKLLDSESAKEPAKQAFPFVTGEMAKLVIENYSRSLAYGSKYILQTLPQILTLWFQLGEFVEFTDKQNQQWGTSIDFLKFIRTRRRRIFNDVMHAMHKHTDRLPAYVFYTVFTQIMARISGCNPEIETSLINIVAKVCATHPQQALWPLLALDKSSNPKRKAAGQRCIDKVQEGAKRVSSSFEGEINKLISSGVLLSDQLLRVCNAKVKDDKRTKFSLKELSFSHQRAAPCKLAIPLEATLQASLPIVTDTQRKHRAFPKETVTIRAFLDEVTILTSLVRPRRIRILGTDGKVYQLLCKPKDDLRKDQRLLEFNSMISRLLKKDVECSKRRLYIRTYAVTPLNEDCGLIEWVDGLRPMRDIILEFLKRKGIQPGYSVIRGQLDNIKEKNDIKIFTEVVLPQFPPVLHEWFVELFPEPGAWFAARLRFTRSCAVMSLVGHVLGLGDRHGENILMETTAGGAFHVDFNCLFDKGKTFECPEEVPFRLTHNMVDAMGAYGHDGPFRKAAELTAALLRQHEHTLMTALYPFVHDPTVDQRNPDRPPAWGDPTVVLEKVRMKVRGLLPLETLPLSVEGYVELQIKEATDPWNLARMYIGWAAFF